MRIYVACLAAYNNGKLHGAWIDASDADDMQEATNTMLAASPEPDAEEWAIHDYELPFSIGEYTDFETIADCVQFIEAQHDEDIAALVLMECQNDISEAESMIENYAGSFDTVKEFGEDYCSELIGEIPSALENYIDWEAVGSDFAQGFMTIQSSYGTTYYFHNY